MRLARRVIEFEVKAPVPPERLEALRAALGPPLRVEAHADAYFAHPARDFARTDEALRLSDRAGRADLTYKGPKLDARTKARREVVVPLADAAPMRGVLEALGFREVRVVRKTRALFDHAGFEVALDEVPPLGFFVELERQLPEGAGRAQADTAGLRPGLSAPSRARDDAERDAMALLARWGLARTERKSYLELLLEAGA
ncbi:MAG: adenylate cyclase, class 2 [Thermoplasmata archaeon]|jgi:adenylate cyclase class 2|nr:adenylate cyclase, class 2 [Thermoplasmata archaeon]